MIIDLFKKREYVEWDVFMERAVFISLLSTKLGYRKSPKPTDT